MLPGDASWLRIRSTVYLRLRYLLDVSCAFLAARLRRTLSPCGPGPKPWLRRYWPACIMSYCSGQSYHRSVAPINPINIRNRVIWGAIVSLRHASRCPKIVEQLLRSMSCYSMTKSLKILRGALASVAIQWWGSLKPRMYCSPGPVRIRCACWFKPRAVEGVPACFSFVFRIVPEVGKLGARVTVSLHPRIWTHDRLPGSLRLPRRYLWCIIYAWRPRNPFADAFENIFD